MVSKTLAIDPGTNFCGYASFTGKKLDNYGFIDNHKKETYEGKLRQLQFFFAALDGVFSCVILEKPEFYHTERGFNSASSQSLSILSITTGVIFGTFRVTPVVLVPAKKWKGQLPKQVVKNRMVAKYDLSDKLKMDIYDAIGIGHWWLNK